MDLRIRPYEGDEKYIFISYCHKDWDLVSPTIDFLSKEGFNVWYDEGINPGTEWPEIIASHLNNCWVCIVFLSENSMASHNCRKEINFATLKKKDILSIVLEPLKMSPGMELLLSNTQMLFKYKYASEWEYYNKIKEADFMTNKSLCEETSIQYAIKRISNSELFNIIKGEHYIGRSVNLSLYRITGNNAIGRVHASIDFDGVKCQIMDNDSKNFTCINNRRLEPNKKYTLEKGDVFTLANEDFVVV